MNSKAIKRQLLAAIAMVLVAAIALGSSTYAWFANNTTVKADGMSVTAQTEGSLLVISKTATLGTQTTVGMELSGANLFPTHLTTADSGTFAATSGWVHSFSSEYATAITDGDAETGLTLNAGVATKTIYGSTSKQDAAQYYDADGKQYFLAGKMYIGLDTQNTTAKCGPISLKSFEITSTNGSTLLPTVRVALVPLSIHDDSATDANKDKAVNTLAGIVATGNKKVDARGTNATADTLATYNGDIKITTANLEAGDYVELGVYIYFDGRDDNCTGEKYDTKTTSVSLTFEAAAPLTSGT